MPNSRFAGSRQKYRPTKCRNRIRRGCRPSCELESILISDRHRNNAADAADGCVAMSEPPSTSAFQFKPVDRRRNRSVGLRGSKGAERRIVGEKLVGFRRLCLRCIARVCGESRKSDAAKLDRIVVASKTPRTDILTSNPMGPCEIARTHPTTPGPMKPARCPVSRRVPHYEPCWSPDTMGIARSFGISPLNLPMDEGKSGMTSRANRRNCGRPPERQDDVFDAGSLQSFQRPANIVRMPKAHGLRCPAAYPHRRATWEPVSPGARATRRALVQAACFCRAASASARSSAT